MIVRSYWSARQLPEDKPKEKLEANDMVSCHKCGLHIPIDEAIKSGDHWYCCQKHIDQQDSDIQDED